MAENKSENKKVKKWSEMDAKEKIEAMPEYKKTVQNKIKELKKKLADEQRKLVSLNNEEKALKFEVIEAKVKKEGKNIEDLM